jgi:hypothetical protein
MLERHAEGFVSLSIFQIVGSSTHAKATCSMLASEIDVI